jgi:hypothetical protein
MGILLGLADALKSRAARNERGVGVDRRPEVWLRSPVTDQKNFDRKDHSSQAWPSLKPSPSSIWEISDMEVVQVVLYVKKYSMGLVRTPPAPLMPVAFKQLGVRINPINYIVYCQIGFMVEI